MSKFTGKHLDGSLRYWYHKNSSKRERRRQDEKEDAGNLTGGVDDSVPDRLRREDGPRPGSGARGKNGYASGSRAGPGACTRQWKRWMSWGASVPPGRTLWSWPWATTRSMSTPAAARRRIPTSPAGGWTIWTASGAATMPRFSGGTRTGGRTTATSTA